ncbi:MAG: type II CRISPR-associated endonuclease Cas1 [Bacteroidetes bacterium]|nr:type II CRISPR-associated endonuclease Cas1 [Bacteroidota bacterium]
MIKRTIYIGNPARLYLREAQLVVDFQEEDKPTRSVPVEDIGLLILDHAQTSITHGLVEALVSNNSAVLFCDSRHLPEGLVLPMSANTTFTEIVRHQVEVSEPLKKQLWKQTIQAKIRNQAALLEKLGKNAENLRRLASKVGSGDPENMEGRAAAMYWREIFDLTEKFTRGRYGDPPNNMLNYGYAILRAIVARSLVGSGLMPVLGMHHRNKYNAFCLADDVMEPYRPYIDQLVVAIIKEMGEEIPVDLTKELKARLLQVPVIDICLDGASSPLMVGMQRTTSSLMKCYMGETRKMLYPEL